ncbi:hypothetical protein [Bradyrhizobium sp.]|uniref:hypothetical protein n=1 Tax=Bradyrhizobium sp. TaxID=376 RepID=UPI003C507F62
MSTTLESARDNELVLYAIDLCRVWKYWLEGGRKHAAEQDAGEATPGTVGSAYVQRG